MKYTRFRMIMQFSLQCRKKTTCCEQSLENDKSHLTQSFNGGSFSGSTPNIWLLLRNLERDSKMQKFKYVQETAGLLCSKSPRYEKMKNKMQSIQSTYEFENAAPYLRAVAKNFRDFWYVFFFFLQIFFFVF